MKIKFNEFGEYIPLESGSRLNIVYRARYLGLMPIVLGWVLSVGYRYSERVSGLESYTPESLHETLVFSVNSGSAEITFFNALVSGLAHFLPVFIFATLVGGICERIFSMQRGREFNSDFVYVALLFTLIVPPTMSFFHIFMGISFGLLFGREIFGGEGKSFLNPALVGGAFLQIAYPGYLTDNVLWPMLNGYAGTEQFNLYLSELVVRPESTVATGFITKLSLWETFPVITALLGGGYLLVKNLVASRLIAGICIGILTAWFVSFLTQSEMGIIPWYGHFLWGGLVFAAFFIAADPSNACVTNAGRWVQGLTIGWLLVLVRSIHPSHPEFTIPVLFLCSLLAPLIDQVVVMVHAKLWVNEHGE